VSFIFDYTDANFEVEKSFIGNYFALKFLIASIKHQIKNRQFQTAEKGSKSGKRAWNCEVFQSHRATPKPWVAGSNPPAPAKNPARKCGIFTFSLLTLHFSLKRQDFWQVISNSEE